eukprot:TRINITY_DN10076_c0_g1_i3.p2 TRINITY_DN10076_c0_g1~~TRINITY_DN10076_c0_g1_i3.p2  ORF type:complete len:115 (-),score=0.98 TRINITY_DN10076_c0_g1_i3:723-1067(-)
MSILALACSTRLQCGMIDARCCHHGSSPCCRHRSCSGMAPHSVMTFMVTAERTAECASSRRSRLRQLIRAPRFSTGHTAAVLRVAVRMWPAGAPKCQAVDGHPDSLAKVQFRLS